MLLKESVGGGWKEASVFVLRPLVLLLLFIPCRSLVVMVEADGNGDEEEDGGCCWAQQMSFRVGG